MLAVLTGGGLLGACSSATSGAAPAADPGPAEASETITKVRKFCVRGKLVERGVEELGPDTVQFYVFPEGCFGSGSVKSEATCRVVSVEQPRMVLESSFRLTPRKSKGPPLPDCGGAGWATCGTGTLAPGKYVAELDGQSVPFEVPSRIEQGGVCSK